MYRGRLLVGLVEKRYICQDREAYLEASVSRSGLAGLTAGRRHDGDASNKGLIKIARKSCGSSSISFQSQVHDTKQRQRSLSQVPLARVILASNTYGLM